MRKLFGGGRVVFMAGNSPFSTPLPSLLPISPHVSRLNISHPWDLSSLFTQLAYFIAVRPPQDPGASTTMEKMKESG